jgi:Uma2 family endonuclease
MGLTVAPADRGRADHILIRNANWRLYRSFVDEIGDGNVRVTYDRGVMEIMSPLPEHERRKKLIGRMVELMTFELNIPTASFGSTTYADEAIDKGLEPDECYYIANEARVRGKNHINLKSDPPPDLAIEVDISYRALRREEIYAGLGVPELWRHADGVTTVLVLGADAAYQSSEFSRAFPFLRVAELDQFIAMIPTVDENTMLHAFRDWVRTLSGGGPQR